MREEIASGFHVAKADDVKYGAGEGPFDSYPLFSHGERSKHKTEADHRS